ncbi:MAG TPA: prepilin-type N-terminal cleavage/methylation domain-containing protein [Pyrinomonadaceae bacterium]|nr:prepilin-type N-terminal cleavage/methylation domain-containing protein [Pyrinomonadaceae bacterium]
MSTKSSINQAGFSLVELMISMVVTLVMMGLASTLLASSFKIRSREDRKSDAVADVQRALNIMTRELGNAGFRLPSGLNSVASNGVVSGDSNNQSIRIVSNLNGAPDPATPDIADTNVTSPNEDLKFLMYIDNALGQRYLVRYDENATNKTTVLANRIDSMVIRYYDKKVTYNTTVDATTGVCDITNVKNSLGSSESEVSPAAAKYLVIAVGVTLPAVGKPGSGGYQPPSQMQLTSDVVLRNSINY